MAITRQRKEQIVSQVKEILQNKPVVFFVDFASAKTSMVLKFRRTIKELGGQYLVVKKNLLGVALKELKMEYEWLLGHSGSLGILYAESDERQVEMAKAARDFIKENTAQVKIKDSLNIVGGFMGKVFWQKDQVIRLSEVPPRETLYGQLVNVMISPLGGFVFGLNSIIRQFLLVLEGIERGELAKGNKKE